MIGNLIKKIVGTKNEREIKRIRPLVEAIGSFEETLKGLTDDSLRAKTAHFKERLEQGEDLDALLPEAFAVTREAARRTIGMRHFDTQLIGGVVLHEGKIAEMATGEGKTLVATLPVYLNALTGLGVHVVTVNDYLAKRDAEWMGPVYRFLGLSVGTIVNDMNNTDRKKAYGCVDSILIDEARTPLIVSGRPEKSTDTYVRVDEAVRRLRNEKHYTLD